MKYPKIFLIVTSGFMMVAHGARMIFEGIKGENVYRPDTFDIFFDWTTLAIAGLVMFTWGLYLFYSRYHEDHHIVWKIRCPDCGCVYEDDICHHKTECPSCHESGLIDLSEFDIDIVRNISNSQV
jgi:hypothetical protein